VEEDYETEMASSTSTAGTLGTTASEDQAQKKRSAQKKKGQRTSATKMRSVKALLSSEVQIYAKMLKSFLLTSFKKLRRVKFDKTPVFFCDSAFYRAHEAEFPKKCQ